MLKAAFLKTLAEQISAMLPAHTGALKKDFEKNCQAFLSKTFSHLDLVTREEFDTQTKVLLRTRKKLDEVSAEIKELEDILAAKERK